MGALSEIFKKNVSTTHTRILKSCLLDCVFLKFFNSFSSSLSAPTNFQTIQRSQTRLIAYNNEHTCLFKFSKNVTRETTQCGFEKIITRPRYYYTYVFIFTKETFFLF